MRKTILWLAIVTLIVSVVFIPSPEVRGEATTHHAGLIIDFNDGQPPQTYCVTFTESSITGYELLERAGVNFTPAFDNNGAAICAIGDVGCPASSCLTCQTPKYWSYWYQQGGSWVYSNLGSSLRQVTNGTVEGWIWGTGSNGPSMIPLDQICDLSPPTETATATATSAPEETPTPTATNTVPPPTSTPTIHPATSTPTVNPPTVAPSATPEPYVSFSIDEDTIQGGTCTTIRWQTDHVQAVYLNGRGMPGIGAQQICPCEDTAYTLRVIYPGDTSEDFTIPLYVLGECTTPTATWTPEPTATGTPIPTVPVYVMPTAAPAQDNTNAINFPPTVTSFESNDPTPASEPLITPSPTLVPQPTVTPVPSTPQPQQITQASLTTSTPIQTLPTRPSDLMGEEENDLPSQGSKYAGYFAFGVLLVGVGAGYIFIQRRQGM